MAIAERMRARNAGKARERESASLSPNPATGRVLVVDKASARITGDAARTDPAGARPVDHRLLDAAIAETSGPAPGLSIDALARRTHPHRGEGICEAWKQRRLRAKTPAPGIRPSEGRDDGSAAQRRWMQIKATQGKRDG